MNSVMSGDKKIARQKDWFAITVGILTLCYYMTISALGILDAAETVKDLYLRNKRGY